MSLIKIYVDDPLVHYALTDVPIQRTKMQIDGILAEYAVKDVFWHFDIPISAYVTFGIEEEVQGRKISLGVRVDCPTLWDREKSARGRRPYQPEAINWKVSLRVMYHFLKTHLETAYAMQSGKAIAFLSYVRTGKDRQVKDEMLQNLNQYSALDYVQSSPKKEGERKVFTREVVNQIGRAHV
jgi:hypothetical protein